jgi:hypothetical protein
MRSFFIFLFFRSSSIFFKVVFLFFWGHLPFFSFFLGRLPFFIFFEAVFHFSLEVVFHFLFEVSSIFFLGRFYFYWGCIPYFLGHLPSWVKKRLHTKNQLCMLSGSALQSFLGWVVGGWGGPSHCVVTPTRVELSWAVTIYWWFGCRLVMKRLIVDVDLVSFKVIL